MINQDEIIVKTKKWVVETVIGLNFCPFAKAVYDKNQIRYFVSQAENTEDLLHDLVQELQGLMVIEPKKTDTCLLIHPFVLQDFLDYNDFLEVAEAALVELNLEGELQIASFHPNYQFEGTQTDDVSNYTNRSPFPILHILRSASIEKAIDSYPDTTRIPEINMEKLRNMDQEALDKLKSLL